MTKSVRPLVILTFCLALIGSLATTTLQQAQAATVPTTVDVVLHKLLFKDTLPTQQANNGTTKPDFSQADVPLNGVTFTVYDVTADFWQLVSKNGGKIEAAQTTLSQDSYQPASSSLIAQVVTAGQGEAYFGDLPLRQGQHAAVYLFKETAVPKNIEASQNLVVVMSSNLQHGNQSRIDLFPKNKMVSRHTDVPKKVPKKTHPLLPQTGATVAAWPSMLGLIIFATVLSFNIKNHKINKWER